MPDLLRAARDLLKGPPVFLHMGHAVELAEQFHETATHRFWFLMAFAVMRAHVHVVVGVPGDPKPEALLRDFKAYGSRRLNRHFGRPPSDTWWTESGSTRIKRSEAEIVAAVKYVAKQFNPLVVWINPECQGMLAQNRRDGR